MQVGVLAQLAKWLNTVPSPPAPVSSQMLILILSKCYSHNGLVRSPGGSLPFRPILNPYSEIPSKCYIVILA